MSLQDPVSDMLTRIRNAQMAGKESVTIAASKLIVTIAKLLQEEGYINGFKTIEEGCKASLEVALRYYNNKPVIEMVKRVSRPGLRVYKAAAQLPKVLGGLGIAIVSTSKGLMTDRKARAAGMGGEVLCILA